MNKELVLEKFIDWKVLSREVLALSPEDIRKNSDKVDWESISRYQRLPEDLIREFQDKVD